MNWRILVPGLALALGCGGGDVTPDDVPAPAVVDTGAAPTAPVDRAGIDTVQAAVPQVPTVGPATVPPGDPGVAPAPPAAAPQQSATQPPAAAVPQQDAAAILNSAAAAYENVRSLRADFVMTFTNRLLRTEMTGRGTLHQQRPDRIALRFTEPAGEVILSDGEHFYIYQPGVNPGQAIRTRATAGGGGGVDLQAQFVGRPTERFQYTLERQENVAGRPAHVLNLVPRERADYHSLKVWLDTRDSLARRFEITEHNGSVRRFDLSGLQVNTPVPDGVFRFVAPEGVRIVDP
jgi:outer membrane lipoprotein carrier protein